MVLLVSSVLLCLTFYSQFWSNYSGHYRLFEKGILHRNINPDNILRCSEPVQCPAVDKLGPVI